MIPQIVYRTEDGCFWENKDEAIKHSVETTALELKDLTETCNEKLCFPGGDIIILNTEVNCDAKDIARGYQKLFKALRGELITEYKIKK